MMIKLKQFFSAVLFVALLASCNTGKNKNATGGSDTTNLNLSDDDTEEANKIISYTNDVIDVLKKYNEALVETIEGYEKAEEDMNEKETNIYMGPGVKFSLLSIEAKKAAVAFGSPTSALGNNRDFFADSLSKYKTLFEKFKAQQSEFDLYIKGKDFLDDGYAKGKEIIQKQYALYDQLAFLKNAINDKIEVLADEAEAITLKDDPMKEAYIAAKQDLRKAKNLVYTINKIDTYTDADVKNIDSAYNDLVQSVESHKNIDRTELIKGNKNDAYTRFYGIMTEELASLKAYVRDIRQNKKLQSYDYDNINNIISQIVTQYNYWVD